MADRIAILEKGEVMQVATPAEVYEAPASRFVAEFVGSINMFEGAVVERNGAGARISHGEGRMIVADNAGDAAVGDKVAFAIRPEKVSVSSREPGSDAINAMGGSVYDIAYLGDMTIYYVKLDDGRVIKSAMLNSARVFDDPLTWDDRAWISFAPDAGVVLTR